MLHPDTLLRREQLATALTEAGFPVRTATLATKATRGGGPPYRNFGRIPLYRWGDALTWAAGRLSLPRSSTSEAADQRSLAPIKDELPARKIGAKYQVDESDAEIFRAQQK